MKKLAFLIALILCCASALFYGCKKEEPLLPYLSELRENIYEGETDGLKISIHYIFIFLI